MAVKCFIRIACAVLSSSALLLLNSCAASSTSSAPAARETTSPAASAQETTPPVAEVAAGILTITGIPERPDFELERLEGMRAVVTAEFRFENEDDDGESDNWKGRYLIAAESVTFEKGEFGYGHPKIIPAEIKNGSVTLPVWELNVTFEEDDIIEPIVTRYSGNDAVNLRVLLWWGYSEEDPVRWISNPPMMGWGAGALTELGYGDANVKFNNGSATGVFAPQVIVDEHEDQE